MTWKCGGCRWFDRDGLDDDGTGRGECCLEPPVWVGPSPADVNEGDWIKHLCGDGWARPMVGVAEDACHRYEEACAIAATGTDMRQHDGRDAEYAPICDCGDNGGLTGARGPADGKSDGPTLSGMFGAFGGAVESQPICESDALETPETAEDTTTEIDMGNFDDSRERLEADVRDFVDYNGWFDKNGWGNEIDCKPDIKAMFIRWLNRQAAITERECRHRIEDLSHDCEMWRDRAEDMRMERDEANAKWREVNDKWAESTASWERITQLDYADTQRIGDLHRKIADLAAALDAERALTEHWRGKCGEMLDAAQEISRIGGLE